MNLDLLGNVVNLIIKGKNLDKPKEKVSIVTGKNSVTISGVLLRGKIMKKHC